MKPTALGFSRASTEGIRGEMRVLAEILVRLPLALNIDGVWYDRETGKRMRENHIKCIIRREYQEQGGTLAGSALQKHLNCLMIGALRVTRVVCAEGREQDVTQLPVADDYL